jgi:hypothetical protein
LPTDIIRSLIAEHHPSVIDGDTTVNLVMIVVDANNNYVTSRTARNPQVLQGTLVSSAADSLATAGQRPRLDDLVDINTIKSVDVMKYGPGVIRSSRIGVVLIALK